MKALLILLFLVSCTITARPIDIIPGGGIYCEPLSYDVQRCRDRYGRYWLCEYGPGGRWRCHRIRYLP